MNYAKQKNIPSYGTIYRFTQQEIEELVRGFVLDKTGLSLNLEVGCLVEDFDVYIRWNVENIEDIDTHFTDEELEKIEDVGLNFQEDFMNRDYLFANIFDSTFIAYYYQPKTEEQEEYYELTIINEAFIGDE